LIVIDDPSRQLVQVGISSLFNPERVRYGLVFAGSVLAVGPVIVLFMFLQRFYVRSVASSGIK
jgi:ABC-type glycerol-3-phosphate transport system permease component